MESVKRESMHLSGVDVDGADTVIVCVCDEQRVFGDTQSGRFVQSISLIGRTCLPISQPRTNRCCLQINRPYFMVI